MENIQNNHNQNLSGQLNLYAALSIFVNKAPWLIENIRQAAADEDMNLLEEYATRLIVYSNNARLDGFTQRIKNVIIAARENKIHAAKTICSSLTESFEKMTQIVSMPV